MSFLNCNIWQINQFPRAGTAKNIYTVNSIFAYNSDTTDYINNAFYLQIPEFEINATEKQSSIINKYLNKIIDLKIPILKNVVNRNGEFWVIDTTFLEYYLYSKGSKEN